MTSLRQRSGQVQTGATLTEVLMALLIMAVGIVSVFTLFPISILLSIRSANLTNARIHKNNVEQYVSAEPTLFNHHLPLDGGASGNPRFRSFWAASTLYQVGDICVPTVKSGGTLPSPNRWFVCVGAMPGPTGTSGATEPRWSLTGGAIETDLLGTQTLAWAPLTSAQLGTNGPQYDGSLYNDPLNPTGPPIVSLLNYVVDPVGWNVYGQEGNLINCFNEFGNKTNTAAGAGVTISAASATDPTALLRLNGGIVDRNAAGWLPVPISAISACTLPDSWETVVEATPTAFTLTDATFPTSLDLANVPANFFSRIVVTSADGRLSAVRPIAAVNNGTKVVQWGIPLPAAFAGLDIGQARIEVLERRYTWLATVRKDLTGRADVKVAVIFKRAFRSEDEHIYFANFGNTTVDLNGDGVADLASSNQVMIAWNPGMGGWMPNGVGTAFDNEPKPLLKPGNYLLDARDLSWYRIQSIDSFDETTSPATAVLSLDRTVRLLTPGDGSGPPALPDPVGRAILMRGVIEVFDL